MLSTFNLFQCSRFRVDDKTSNHYIIRNKRMCLNGLYGLADGFGRVLESLQPVMQVDAALLDSIKRLRPSRLGIAQASLALLSLLRQFLNLQLIDGDNEATHG